MLSSRPAPRILFFTAADEPALAKEALTMGAAGFLTKSGIDTKYLVSAIVRVAQGGTAFPPDLIEKIASLANEPGLTLRQIQVLGMKAQGMKTAEIARRMNVTPRTVDSFLTTAFERLGVRNTPQAIYVLSKTGIL